MNEVLTTNTTNLKITTPIFQKWGHIGNPQTKSAGNFIPMRPSVVFVRSIRINGEITTQFQIHALIDENATIFSVNFEKIDGAYICYINFNSDGSYPGNVHLYNIGFDYDANLAGEKITMELRYNNNGIFKGASQAQINTEELISPLLKDANGGTSRGTETIVQDGGLGDPE